VSDLLRILALSGLAKNGIGEVNEGTEMGQIGNVHIKQFGMGKGNLGIQLTGDDGYVQLNREEAAQLAARLAKWAGSKDMALPGEYESVDSDDENFIEGRNDGPRSECCDAPLDNYENGLGICTDCKDHAAAHNEDELDEVQVTENKMSEQITKVVDLIMGLAKRDQEQWADDPEMDGGDANYYMNVARELEGGDWVMAREAILDGDTDPKEQVLEIVAGTSPELLKAIFPRDAEKEQYLATMRETTQKLKDELIKEMMGD